MHRTKFHLLGALPTAARGAESVADGAWHSYGAVSGRPSHPTELRALSVKEYARIQQFPDDWRFSGSTAEKYRQIGNAVPVGLGYVIGTTILNDLRNWEGKP